MCPVLVLGARDLVVIKMWEYKSCSLWERQDGDFSTMMEAKVGKAQSAAETQWGGSTQPRFEGK